MWGQFGGGNFGANVGVYGAEVCGGIWGTCVVECGAMWGECGGGIWGECGRIFGECGGNLCGMWRSALLREIAE